MVGADTADGAEVAASVGSVYRQTPSAPALPTATYLTIFGGVLVAAGIVFLLVTAGFPPGITTTYEFHPDGSTTSSTSPDTIEDILIVLLLVIGGVLLRASWVMKHAERR